VSRIERKRRGRGRGRLVIVLLVVEGGRPYRGCLHADAGGQVIVAEHDLGRRQRLFALAEPLVAVGQAERRLGCEPSGVQRSLPEHIPRLGVAVLFEQKVPEGQVD
jgi:hypothetical protein